MKAVLELLLSGLAIVVFTAAAISDARTRRISNRLSAGLALLGLARITIDLMNGAGAASAVADLAVAVVVFGLGAIAFRFRVLGGGDVKLLAASALWLGLGEIGAFLLATAFAGGLLAMIFLGWQLLRPGPRLTSKPPSLPYAIAIAAGGIMTTAIASLG